MISEAEIIKKIEQWVSSAEGKKRLKAMGIKLISSAAQAKLEGEKMKEMLYQKVVAVIPSFSKDGIIVGEPMRKNNYQVRISFDKNSLFRESLNGGYDGVKDIVLHFTYGWHAKGYTYGDWHGNTYISRKDRDENPFLKEAVSEYNSLQTYATAMLEPEYIDKKEKNWS